MALEADQLRLDAALRVLQQAGRAAPSGVKGSAPWLQALLDTLCDLAAFDPATGWANRLQLELALMRELDEVRACGCGASLVLLRVSPRAVDAWSDSRTERRADRFPDPLAAEIEASAVLSDRAVQAVLDALQARLRPDDLLARWDGQTLAVLLGSGSSTPAVERAEQLGPLWCQQLNEALSDVSQAALPLGPHGWEARGGAAHTGAGWRASVEDWMARAQGQLLLAYAGAGSSWRMEPTVSSLVSAEEKAMLFGDARAGWGE